MWYSMPMTETLTQYPEDAIDDAQEFFISMLDTESLIEYYRENPSPTLLDCVMAKIQGESADSRRTLASLESTPADILSRLVDDESPSVLHTCAANPSLPIAGVIQLSFHGEYWARAGAAANRNLPAEHVKRLAKDKAFEVREIIASHKNLTEKDLILLSNDKEHFVLAAVAANPRLPLRHIKRLSKSKYESVAEVAAENLLWVTVNEYNKKISW